MKKWVVAAVMAWSAAAFAEPKAEVKAGTGLENREITGAGDSFKKTDTVYVWSSVTDADGQKVAHVWKLDGKEVFKAEFDVKSKRWRINSKRRTPAAVAARARSSVACVLIRV